MISTLFILLALLAGLSLVRLLPTSLTRLETAALSLVAATLGGTWLLFLAVALIGFSWGYIFSLILLIVLVLFTWRRGCLTLISSDPKTARVLYILLTLSGILFGYLIYTHTLQVFSDGWYSAADSWGDIALHMTLASFFAYSPRLHLQMPIFPHMALTYPFLFDFLSGMLLRGGWSWQASLGLPLFAMCMCLVQLFFTLVQRVTKSAATGFLAVLFFIGMGSPAGFFFFLSDSAQHKPTADLLSFSGVDYTHLTDQGLQLTNSLTSLLLPQRGIVLGLAILLSIVFLLYLAYTEQPIRPAAAIAATIMTGLLPFVHVHMFLATLVIWVVFLIAYVRQEESLGIWVKPILLGIVLALPQIYWQLHGTNTQEFTHIHFGWMTDTQQESVLTFWFYNLGLVPILALIGGIYLYYERNYFALSMGAVALLLFIICNSVILQPNAWDNIKLLVVMYMILSAGAAVLCVRWFSRPYFWLPGALIIGLCVITGGLNIFRESIRHDQFLTNDEIAFAAEFRKTIPAGSLVLTNYRHNNPIPTLTGRPIVMGYPGWLWTYGLNYLPVQDDIATMFAGGPNTAGLLKDYGVKYVALDPAGEYGIIANKSYFSAHYPLVLRYAGWEVYQVTP